MESSLKDSVTFRIANERMLFNKIPPEQHSDYWQLVKNDWKNCLKLPLTPGEEEAAQVYYKSLDRREDQSQSAETDGGHEIFYDRVYEQENGGQEDIEYPYIKFGKCWVNDSIHGTLRRSYNNVIVILSDDANFPLDAETEKYPIQVPIQMQYIVLNADGKINNINDLVKENRSRKKAANAQRQTILVQANAKAEEDEDEAVERNYANIANNTRSKTAGQKRAFSSLGGGKKVKPKRSKRCKQTKKSKSKKNRRTRKATII